MNTPQEFAALLAGLRALPASGDGALATLTRTSGSTFRRAGARMLVHADGRIVRGLSGGCPERDIVAHARAAMACGDARIVRYDREQNFDVMLEMGCGGELEVLIEPLRDAADWQFAEAVDLHLQARDAAVLATVYARDGICLQPRPQRLLSARSGTLADAYDEIGDTPLRAALHARIAELPPRVRAVSERIDCDGYQYAVQFETLQPPFAAYLFGINATSLALADFLARLGWELTLIDPRAEATDGVALPEGARVAALTPAGVATLTGLDARSFAVVMTHQLEQDIDYVAQLARQPLAYIGAIGARRRVARLTATLPALPPNLYAPAGIDIGAETPEEIALAIATEMLAIANGHEGGLLSRHQLPIHR